MEKDSCLYCGLELETRKELEEHCRIEHANEERGTVEFKDRPRSIMSWISKSSLKIPLPQAIAGQREDTLVIFISFTF